MPGIASVGMKQRLRRSWYEPQLRLDWIARIVVDSRVPRKNPRRLWHDMRERCVTHLLPNSGPTITAGSILSTIPVATRESVLSRRLELTQVSACGSRAIAHR